MAKLKQSGSQDIVAVELTEREWDKVLEVPAPSDLYWLARISMIEPVLFDRQDLGLLVLYLRTEADTSKAPTKRRLLEQIADKMAKIMQAPRSSARKHSLVSQNPPNNKQTAVKLMRQDLRNWKKDLPTADVAMRTKLEEMTAQLNQCAKGGTWRKRILKVAQIGTKRG